MSYHFLSFGAPHEFSLVAASQGSFTLMTEIVLQQAGTGAAVFEMNTVAFEFGKDTVALKGNMTIAGVQAELSLSESNTPGAGWLIAGGTQAGQVVSVRSLIADLSEKFGVTVPAPFKTFELSDIGLSYETGSESFHFSCRGGFNVAGTAVAAVVTIGIVAKASALGEIHYDYAFGGTITIGSLQFELVFDGEPTSNTFIATYSQPDGATTSIRLNSLINTISADMAREVPDGIEIDLKDVKFVYHQDKGAGSKQFALAIDLGTAIDLANLPMVGQQLPPDLSLGLDDLQILYSSGPFSEAQLVGINNLMPQNVAGFAASGLEKGLTLSGQLNIAGYSQTLTVGSGASTAMVPKPTQKALPNSPKAANAMASQPAIPAAANTSVKWFNVEKTIGPATFKRIGIDFKNSELWLYLDAGISVGGLSIALDELSVGSSIKHFRPSFNLSGLSIDFNKNGLEIGAAFLRQQLVINGLSTEVYNGAAIIRTTGFALSAMGSYCYYDGHPSLFIYAYLEKALGGPSFFFVEGLAAGFGYNRALIMPDISQVANFPLVAQVMGGSSVPADANPAMALQAQLTALSAYVPPSIGDIFLAVGVKFSSFKLINSFALLVVSFGNRMEIDLLGQSNIVVPLQELGKEFTPLAEVKILLMAKYLPDEGFLAVLAQLSSDSYVFSKDCHLTGGAAFYSWFKGEHEGDFVATVGGYHPAFKVPAHYPSVPRLALNWQVSDKLSVKGDMYFALCAHAFMAGGHLEAVYEDGDFKAWFKAGADFLVTWQPYHYEARIYVSMGASYTIHFFGSHTISVDLGADLAIWGPEFSGRATVHIYVCDITIHFGADDSTDLKPITWDAFKTKCLPDASKVLGAAVTSGQHDKDEFQNPIVNPKELELIINSAIPVKNISVNTEEKYNIASSPDIRFGVSPMAKNNDDVESALTVVISHNPDKPNNSLDYMLMDSDSLRNLIITPQQKAVPSAIWGTSFQHDLNAENRTVTVSNGIKVHTAEPIALPAGGVAFPQLTELVFKDAPIILARQPASTPLPFSGYNSTFNVLGKQLGIAE
ncbi:hypothetical protein ACVWYF_003590 [Hymenobacter sp. UYAg731]